MRYLVYLCLIISLGLVQADYYTAAQNGDLDQMENYYQNGTNANSRNAKGYTALAYAAEKNDIEALELAFQYKALPDIPNKTGYTPLNLASGWGNLEAVQNLLHHGASANIAAQDGNTPLMNAAQYGYTEVVKELLKNGANPYAENRNGKTAEALARDWGHKDVIAALSAVIDPASPKQTRRKKAITRTTQNSTIVISENVTHTPSALQITEQPVVTPAVIVSPSVLPSSQSWAPTGSPLEGEGVAVATDGASINLETEPVSRNLP